MGDLYKLRDLLYQPVVPVDDLVFITLFILLIKAKCNKENPTQMCFQGYRLVKVYA